MKSKIEEIAFLAREKGFEAKTLSTKFTMNAYLGLSKSKTFLINETCDYLLLAEMQKWLREKHQIFSEVLSGEYNDIKKIRFESCIFSDLCENEDEDFDEKNIYDVYEDALMDSIKESFELIK